MTERVSRSLEIRETVNLMRPKIADWRSITGMALLYAGSYLLIGSEASEEECEQ
jgi:hypothetical protein